MVKSMMESKETIQISRMNTSFGILQILADTHFVYGVRWVNLHDELEYGIMPGDPAPANQMREELERYFSGDLMEFTTPLLLVGSPFQVSVWEMLRKIPFGETRSYAEMAHAIGNPLAFRAVALANRANRFAIVIPCHRVIYSSGKAGGYRGGIEKKEWLLQHERRKK